MDGCRGALEPMRLLAALEIKDGSGEEKSSSHSKPPPWGEEGKKKSKKKAALQLCHVWSHRAVQAEWKIALTPNKTVSLGRALAQGVTKICHPVWLPLRQPWTHEYIKSQYHIPALLLRNKGLSPAAVLGCAVHV